MSRERSSEDTLFNAYFGFIDGLIYMPTDEQFLSEANDLVVRMKNANIPLRIMAGCAVRIHCPAHVELHQAKMQRNIRDTTQSFPNNHI